LILHYITSLTVEIDLWVKCEMFYRDCPTSGGSRWTISAIFTGIYNKIEST